MKQESEEQVVAQKDSQRQLVAKQLLAEVREFGYRPREQRPSEDAELEKERLLAKRIRRSKFEEFLTSAELKEFKASPAK